ncbi:unnamed protein product [Vicia faba]|uniref:Protein kinase domain-containing protein n=1 Tax=Vicia faba TaxID=3906 RepID=A0AAV0Z2B8_VICFA|nr:unnamed protein product [Vicia faba]
MSCFPCVGKSRQKNLANNSSRRDKHTNFTSADKVKVDVNLNLSANDKKEDESKHDQLSLDVKNLNLKDGVSPDGKVAKTFTFQELEAATGNFRADCFVGEGGFGKVYKGNIEKINQVVAIKQLDPNGLQGIREFVVEVLTLSLADHPNLVKLLGFCAEGEQRLLVYEYMPLGSLENHLHDLSSGRKPLDWNTRMRIAAGAARGEDYNPKLSDFGLAKVGPIGDKTHVSTRVMGTYGYCAPDYAMTGQLTFKSDIYSFGVVLLELITGRKAIDHKKPAKEQNLVAWARPLFRDRRRFSEMVDPLLQGHYPVRADVVTALNYLASQKYDPQTHPIQRPRKSSSSTRGSSAGHRRVTSNDSETDRFGD